MHNQADYRQVAELHSAAIDQGFLSQLGPNFLSLLYEVIDKSPTSILIISKENGLVRGFVCGTVGLGPVYRSLLRRLPSLALALLPLIASPKKILRVFEILRHISKTPEEDLPLAELLSIAVTPAVRGSRLATQLYEGLRKAFGDMGIPEFRIVVGKTLGPAQAFYRKMGAMPRAEIAVHGGAVSTVFVDGQPK